MESVNVEEKSISIAIEEIPREEWHTKVYEPDILGKPNTVIKGPGY